MNFKERLEKDRSFTLAEYFEGILDYVYSLSPDDFWDCGERIKQEIIELYEYLETCDFDRNRHLAVNDELECLIYDELNHRKNILKKAIDHFDDMEALVKQEYEDEMEHRRYCQNLMDNR